ncbi:MAG: phytanoyl-CoA dioxygenase family protein [Nostocaceae cyanobacterium]|nr:phytanoyl-CoA dioxygenase family protein [Nostocaceae cyanobacterium]
MYLISTITGLLTKDYPAAFRRIAAEEPARFIGKEIDLIPVAEYLDQRRTRALLLEKALLEEEKKKLTDLQKNIILSIQQTGYWQGSIDDLFDEEQANQLISKYAAVYQPLQNKLREYHYDQKNTVTLDPAYISNNPNHWIIYQAGLNENLLQLAHQYIGLPVGYHGAEIRLSRANPNQPDDTGPRSPHFDAEEGQKYPMLKAVLYLTDVTEDNGPFTIYHGSEKKPLTGNKGTLILADTSKYLHHGMPLKNGERMAMFLTYTSHRPRYPHRCIIWPHSNLAVRKMTANMNPMQQRAARWRESLPISLCPVSYYPFPGHNFYLGDRNRTV